MDRFALYVLVIAIYAISIAIVAVLMVKRFGGKRTEKISVVLQMIAVYAFVVSAVSALGVFEAFPDIKANLTSSDPVRFASGNFEAFAFLFSAVGQALSPESAAHGMLFILRIPIIIVFELVLFAYILLHFFVVVPIAYCAYAVMSAPVDAIIASLGQEVVISQGETAVGIQTLVQKNAPAIRSFLVGVPAFALATILRALPVIRPVKRQPEAGHATPGQPVASRG